MFSLLISRKRCAVLLCNLLEMTLDSRIVCAVFCGFFCKGVTRTGRKIKGFLCSVVSTTVVLFFAVLF